MYKKISRIPCGTHLQIKVKIAVNNEKMKNIKIIYSIYKS